ELTSFAPVGSVTLLYIADLHGQLVPVYLREPSVESSAVDALGRVPDVPGPHLLAQSGIAAGTPAAHALTADDFVSLARPHGRIGGLDRMATVVKAVRAERGEDRVLLLDGGDTWQGSLGSYRTRGEDMVDCMRLLRPDAMTGHWEFTYGEQRVRELV